MSLLSTGLTSRTGVPSTASRLRTRTLVLSIDRISTRCSPIGFGRWGEPGAEHALLRSRGVLAARMHAQNVATRTVEPRDDDYLVSCPDSVETLEHRRLEDEARVRRPLSPCFGADAGSVKGDSTRPIGVTSNGGWLTSWRLDPDCHRVIAGRSSFSPAVRVSPVRKSATTGASTLIFTLWLTPGKLAQLRVRQHPRQRAGACLQHAGAPGAVGDERRHRDRGPLLGPGSGAPYIVCSPKRDPVVGQGVGARLELLPHR